MITRREKLLIRPWEQRRYENHRRKVHSALPAIDVGPPASRVHVLCKLKKQQKESERCNKIEKDNLKLLQRMRNIMSTSRVDHFWTTAQPSFLNRVEVYNTKTKVKTEPKYDFKQPDFDKRTRKERCNACTPKKIIEPTIPEERIPWEPPKPQVSRRRSQSLPSKNREKLEILTEESNLKNTPDKLKFTPPRSKSSKPIRKKLYVESATQTIILSRGELNLAVNFPPDTLVKLKEGRLERVLVGGTCQCKAIKV